MQQAEMLIQQFVDAGFPPDKIAELKNKPIEVLLSTAQAYNLPASGKAQRPPGNTFTGMDIDLFNNPQAVYNQAMQSANKANQAYAPNAAASYKPLFPDPSGANRPINPQEPLQVYFPGGAQGSMTYDQALQHANQYTQGKAWFVKR